MTHSWPTVETAAIGMVVVRPSVCPSVTDVP